MNRSLALVGMFVVLVDATCFAQESDRQPAGELEALVTEYDGMSDAFERAASLIEDESRRDAYYEEHYPAPERFYPRIMAVVERHPRDAAAVDALVWVVNHSSPEPTDRSTQREALDALCRDHIASEKLPLVFEQADDADVRRILEGSPLRRVRGLACYDLAEKRLSRVRTVTRWRIEYPDWQRRWKWLEQTHNAYLVTTDVDQVAGESEALLERVVRDFADVPIDGRRNGRTLGELAKGHLFERRHLAIGKPAPPLKSIDLEGNPVRLSDLTGRVVVLDVWATWCGPCVAMIPYQRELVKRLEGRPFTLVGISADEERETVAAFLKRQPMPWTHWFNGAEGGVIAELNVHAYPRTYVLDANGVIRYKDIRGKVLDRAVDGLLKEIEKPSRPTDSH